MAEGTVLTRVHAPASWSARSSTVPATTAAPPALSGANTSKTDRSKQTEVEARTRASSAGPNVSRAQPVNAAALPWVIMTPFGRPVEREV